MRKGKIRKFNRFHYTNEVACVKRNRQSRWVQECCEVGPQAGTSVVDSWCGLRYNGEESQSILLHYLRPQQNVFHFPEFAVDLWTEYRKPFLQISVSGYYGHPLFLFLRISKISLTSCPAPTQELLKVLHKKTRISTMENTGVCLNAKGKGHSTNWWFRQE